MPEKNISLSAKKYFGLEVELAVNKTHENQRNALLEVTKLHTAFHPIWLQTRQYTTWARFRSSHSYTGNPLTKSIATFKLNGVAENVGGKIDRGLFGSIAIKYT
jgi:hypothetical protein